jgi:RNA polymerase sigma-70 factor, ECF subfamily
MATHKKPGGRPPPEGPPDAPDPDQDIRDLIGAGKLDAALELLMKRHGNAIYRYCREALRDPTLADDVQQKVFFVAYRDLDTYAGRSFLRAWLFGIAHYRVLDAAKSRSRNRTRIVDPGELPDIPDRAPGVDQRIDEGRLIQALQVCMGKLAERIRSCVLLRYQQGLTFEQMSRVLEEKPGTLQARVSRAMRQLRQCIETQTAGVV